jgi:hypothetical protein
MINAENRKELAFVLDDHAGAKLCRFNAAHNLPKMFPISEIQAGQERGRIRNDSRHAEEKSRPSANQQYKWAE